MSFEELVRIPEDRIGVLIGKSGKIKSKIEGTCSVKLDIDSKNGEVQVLSKKKINMPTVAIGGINDSNYKKILSNGADFIACSNYIWNNKKLDPVSAIKKFK